MKIFIASDHAGFELKGRLIEFLQRLDYVVVDKGAYVYNKSDDYPDFISLVARKISSDPENTRGIILGGSGQGEAMVANRFSGVRAAVFYGTAVAQQSVDISGRESKDPFEIIKLSREHNDANILSIAARYVNEEDAKTAIKLWLETPFSDDERHKRRIQKIDQINFLNSS